MFWMSSTKLQKNHTSPQDPARNGRTSFLSALFREHPFVFIAEMLRRHTHTAPLMLIWVPTGSFLLDTPNWNLQLGISAMQDSTYGEKRELSSNESGRNRQRKHERNVQKVSASKKEATLPGSFKQAAEWDHGSVDVVFHEQITHLGSGSFSSL